jgi:hypothetical protein
VLLNKAAVTTTMKFSILLFALLSAAPTTVHASPMKTCAEQFDCLDFTIDQVDTDACSGTDVACEFNVCITLNLGGSCVKSDSDTVSHTCVKAGEVCLDGGSFGEAAVVSGIGDGYSACQTVGPGATAEFLMKDGNGDCAAAGPLLFEGGSANCVALETIDGYESCTGNVGTECVWTIVAPECVLPPADDSTPPTDDSTPPADDSTPPADDSTPPADDSTTGGDGVLVTASDETTAAEEEEYLCA